MLTVGTRHFTPSVAVQDDLDIFWGICYPIDDEPLETEDLFDAFNIHDAMLEKADNGLFDVTYCNA